MKAILPSPFHHGKCKVGDDWADLASNTCSSYLIPMILGIEIVKMSSTFTDLALQADFLQVPANVDCTGSPVADRFTEIEGSPV